jgi:hypothetical protein
MYARRLRLRSMRAASHVTHPIGMAPWLSEMMNWPPHDIVVIVYDSDDDEKQSIPQCTVATDISHPPAASAHHSSPCNAVDQSTDTNTKEIEPSIPTVEQAEESTQPSTGHLARCQVCQLPHDLMHFYEPAEGGGHMFTSCRTCWQRNESATDGLCSTYPCPCGSVLRATSRKSHEKTKKHKAWNRRVHSGQLQPVT